MKFRTSRQFLSRLASRRSARLLSIALAGSGLFAASSARAALYSWDGTAANITGVGNSASAGGTGTWSTAIANWDVGPTAHVVWSSGNTAVFGGTAGTVTLGTAISADGMNIGTGGYTIATSTFVLTLGAGGITTTNATGTTTISSGTGGNVTLGAAQSWTVASGGTLTVTAPVATGGFALTLANTGPAGISSIISGTGSLIKNNTGTLNLSGINTYSGGTTINQGTVTVTQNTGLGSGALSVNNTNTTAAGTNTILNLPTGTNISVGSLSGAISTPTSGTNTATINTQSNGATIYNLGILQTAAGTYAGVIAGSGSISLAGTSTNILTLSGTNTYSGGTTIGAGTIALGNASGLGATTGSLKFNSPANGGTTSTLDIATFSPTIGGLTLQGGAVIKSTGSTTASLTVGSFDTVSSGTVSAVLAGSAPLTKTGSGVVTFQGANTYTGATIIGALANPTTNGGTLELNGAGSIAQSSGITINGTLGGLANPGGANTNSNLYLNNTTLTSSAGAADRIGNSTTVTLNYGGELRDYGSTTAGVTLSESFGTLALGSGLGVVTLSQGAAAGSSVSLAAGAFSRGSNFATGLIRGTNLGLVASSTFGRVTITDRTGLTQIGTSTSTTGAEGSTKNLTIVPYFLGATTVGTTPQNLGTNFVTYDTGGGLRRLGTNEQSLITAGAAGDNVRAAGGANAVAGANVFNSLLLNGGGTSATPGTTATTVTGDGSSLTLTSGALANVADNSSANVASVGGFSSIIFGTTGANEAVISNVNTNGALTISSPIDTFATGGALTKAGAGTLILGADNLYTGQTTVNAGTLQIGTGNGGSLASGGGAIVLAGGNLTFGRSDTGLTVTNAISGFGTVTQSGTGMTTYSGTGTYTGGTTISSGILSVTGNLPDAGVIAVSGGTYNVASNDTVGAVTLSSGNITGQSTATLSPASLTLNNALASSVLANIGGATSIIQAGAGTTTLGGASNAYTGGTFINNGTILLSSATALPSTGTVSFNGASSKLDLGGNTVTIGNLASPSTTASITSTVTNGTLNLGANSFNYAPGGTTASTTSTLDLTGLTAFNYNQAAAGQSFSITVGPTGGNTTTNATVNLAAGTNSITATNVNVGVGNAVVGGIGTLNLGTTNTINAANIQVGGYRSYGGTVQFESGLTNPTLTLRGVTGGISAAQSLTVGLPQSGGVVNTALFDTSAGTINGIVNNLIVGQIGTASVGPAGSNNVGTFKMQTGTLNAGTITLSSVTPAIATTVTAVNNIGTFTQNAGAVLVDNILFNSQTSGVGTAFTDTGVYNLGTSTTTGILSVGNISLGSVVANAASTATLNFNNGTLTNYDNTANGFSGQGNANGSTTTNVQNLTLAGTTGGGAAANATTLNIALAATGTHNFLAEAGQSITETSTAIITGTGGLTANGPGTVIFQGANTYTGATTVNGGSTLNLDFNGTGAPATNILSSSSALVLNGGALNVLAKSGTATSQTVNGLTLNSGNSTVAVNPAATNPNSVVLNLGAITRNTGSTVVFTLPTGTQNSGYGITTSSGNFSNTSSADGTTGILGGWATTDAYNYATVSGTNIVTYAGSQEYNNVAGFANVTGKDITDGLGTSGPGYDGSATNTATINSLRFNTGSRDTTVNINGGNTLTISSGGILVTPNLGTQYARINGGTLTTGSTGDLIVIQNNTGSGHLQIGSAIAGNGGLTKSGVGQLDLNGSDATYTGVTTVNGGTLLLTAATTGTTGVTLNRVGTLQLDADNRINDAAPVTLNGGILNLGGHSEGAVGTNGVGALTLTATSTLDFGPTGSSNLIEFGGVGTHTPGSVLLVTEWEGTLGTANGTDRLLFAGTSTAFTSIYSQSEVSFNGASGYGVTDFGNYFEVFGGGSPVPEPATWAAGFLTLAAAGWKLRRRKIQRTV